MPSPTARCLLLGSLVAIVAALAPWCLARAGEPVPRWVQRHYGSTEGLPVGSAGSARIDADGFLWLATHDGLARFDGQHFDVHESMRFPALSGNRVQSLHLDAQRRLYAYTAHGDWVSVRSGRIERVALGEEGPQAVRHVDPASLCVTTALALYCPDAEGRFALRVRFPSQVEPVLALPGDADATWMIATTGDVWMQRRQAWHRLWRAADASGPQLGGQAVSTGDGALWTNAAGRLLRVSSAGEPTRWLDGDSPAAVLKLRLGADGRVWIGAANGVYTVDGAGQLRRVFVEAGDPSPSLDYRSWHAPDGALWVSHGGRLWRLGTEPGAQAGLRAPDLVSSGVIQDLLFGDDDVIWVTTLRDGVYRLSRARVDVLDASTGLGGGNVYGVTRDRDGNMWLGSLDDGLTSVDREGRMRHYGRSDGLPGDNPWLVAAADDGSLYVGTYAPGLWFRPRAGQRFEQVALPDELLGEQVLAIVFDASGGLWLGTTAGAWHRQGGEWQRQWPRTPRRVRVAALALADDGAVWFGSAEGVWRQQGAHGHRVAEALLSHTSVRDLYRTTDGALWISTDGRGLVRVAADDPLGLRALQLGRSQGLPSNSPHTVREDANGHVWVNSNQGIFRISRPNLLAFVAGDRQSSLSPLVLGLSDGLTELEGNGGVQPAAAFDPGGRLWFPSQRGVVRFDPLEIPLREHPPRASIDGLESDGRPLALEAGGALPVGVRNVLIRYGAADLGAGSQVHFRYRLLPQDRNWTEAANERSASFSMLQPGHHRFELLAGNSDGIWAPAPVALDFEVSPYWHETRTVRLLALAAAGVLALALIRLRLRRLRLRAVDLNRKVRQRTSELVTEKARVEAALSELAQTHAELAQTHREIEDSNERLAEQAQRLEALDRFRSRLLADVSHELRTPVMLVSLPLRDLQRAGALTSVDRSRLELSLKQLDRLGGLVEQLVGLVQAEAGQARLRLRRLDLAALLDEIAASYQPAAERVGVVLVLRASGIGAMLFADREHLATIVGNLVDNAIKHAPRGSTVTIVLTFEDSRAVVEVSDEGRGFDPGVGERLFERFYRVDGPPRHGREGLGIGLALARELVELHGGRITASSDPGRGATFRVELPLGSAHVALDDLALDPAPSSPLPVPAGARGDGRVLLVEDHPDLAAYLAERLGEHVPVTCVGSVEQAEQVLADEPGIRLVISDVVLPGASGLDLCRRVANLPPERRRPVILISAKAADSDRSAGFAAGAVAYLAKPFSFEALLGEMARAWPEATARLVASPPDPAALDPLLAIAMDEMGNHEFAIGGWAVQAHLSERQLRRRVGELTGQSPQTWLREQRLLRVRHLLRSGASRTLAEAGARCGLDNPAYLYRSYRARFGEH